MSGIVSLAFPAATGVNTSDETLYLDRTSGGFIQHATGLRVENNRWHTAHSIRELEVTGDPKDIAGWEKTIHQAAIWYQPRKGAGNHYIGKGPDRIVESADGKLWTLTLKGGKFILGDASYGVSGAKTGEAWLCQGENYVVRTDGRSNTQIYDGSTTVESRGYSRSAKQASRFPNKAGPTVYAGGRFWTTLFGRRVYASDSLHQLNQTDASDLLKFTDQTYDYLNVYFAGPSSGGDITALTTTVDSGVSDSRAQGEVVVFEENGSMWGIPIGVPRKQWPTTIGMRKPRSKETAATGQNAFAVRDGDILMRTLRGVESFNLLSRSRGLLGNPTVDLSADMDDLLSRDYEPYLGAASLVNPLRWNRMFCTMGPEKRGGRLSHKGFLAINWNPGNERSPSMYCLEGVGVIPPSMGRIIKFLPVYSDNKSRLFAITDKGGAGRGVIEFTQTYGKDWGLSGLVDKQWQLVTRRLTSSGPYMAFSPGEVWVYLDGMRSGVTVELQYRTDRNQCWKVHKRVDVKLKRSAHCGSQSSAVIPMGTPGDNGAISWIQLRLRGVGITGVDFAIRTSEVGTKLSAIAEGCVIAATTDCDFDPYDPEPCLDLIKT